MCILREHTRRVSRSHLLAQGSERLSVFLPIELTKCLLALVSRGGVAVLHSGAACLLVLVELCGNLPRRLHNDFDLLLIER